MRQAGARQAKKVQGGQPGKPENLTGRVSAARTQALKLSCRHREQRAATLIQMGWLEDLPWLAIAGKPDEAGCKASRGGGSPSRDKGVTGGSVLDLYWVPDLYKVSL